MKHWAHDYIGKPWRKNANGPDAFNCWGLLSVVCEARLNVHMPLLDLDGPEQEKTLRKAVTGWTKVDQPQPDDVVVMLGPNGRHVGYMVEADGKLGVLHANGYDTPKGPRGSVMFQPIEQLAGGGYKEFEFWRRQ